MLLSKIPQCGQVLMALCSPEKPGAGLWECYGEQWNEPGMCEVQAARCRVAPVLRSAGLLPANVPEWWFSGSALILGDHNTETCEKNTGEAQFESTTHAGRASLQMPAVSACPARQAASVGCWRRR